MVELVEVLVPEVRRLRGIGHLGVALRHYPYLTLAVVVLVIALLVYSNRRR